MRTKNKSGEVQVQLVAKIPEELDERIRAIAGPGKDMRIGHLVVDALNLYMDLNDGNAADAEVDEQDATEGATGSDSETEDAEPTNDSTDEDAPTEATVGETEEEVEVDIVDDDEADMPKWEVVSA